MALLVNISIKFDHIWGSYGQETSQKQPKMIYSAGSKTLENTNQAHMKLDPYIYHSNTFHLPQN